MRYFTRSFNIDQPTTALFQPALLRHHPHVVEIGDFWGRYGSGIGLGNSAALSSLGEYYERRHFFSEVSSHRKSLLSDTLEDQETTNFTRAFQQTMLSSKTPDSLYSHMFHKTSVKRLSDFSNCEIPTVCISISPTNLGNDNRFHPVRDTCGCSFHWNLENAILGAIKESIERQFLLKFWLTKKCNHELNLPDYHSRLPLSGALPILQALASSGSVTALDISDENFPGKCIIVLYGASAPEHHVHYCAGMAYGDSQEAALEKSIYELWQTFRFIRNFHTFNNDIESIKDPYLRHFLNINNHSTYLNIANNLITSDTKSQTPTKPINTNTLVSAIKQSGISGYIYIKPTKISRRTYFFCKYVSPTAFMHMNNSSHLNIQNKYSDNFIHQIDETRQSSMVPFP